MQRQGNGKSYHYCHLVKTGKIIIITKSSAKIYGQAYQRTDIGSVVSWEWSDTDEDLRAVVEYMERERRSLRGRQVLVETDNAIAAAYIPRLHEFSSQSESLVCAAEC